MLLCELSDSSETGVYGEESVRFNRHLPDVYAAAEPSYPRTLNPITTPNEKPEAAQIGSMNCVKRLRVR